MSKSLRKSKQKCAKVKIFKLRSFPASTARENSQMAGNLEVISQGVMETRVIILKKKKRINLNPNMNQNQKNNLAKRTNNQRAHSPKLEE